MGLLQGPRLMAWTTKSPIQGNHWVPIGCRALLGSVKDLSSTANLDLSLIFQVSGASYNALYEAYFESVVND